MLLGVWPMEERDSMVKTAPPPNMHPSHPTADLEEGWNIPLWGLLCPPLMLHRPMLP